MHKQRLKYYLCASLIAALALTGCGQDASSVRDDRTGIASGQPESQAAEVSEAADAEASKETASVADSTESSASDAAEGSAADAEEPEFIEADEAYNPTEITSDYDEEYKASLIRISETYETPDRKHQMKPANGVFENTAYAVQDVDNDGREELLLRFADSSSDNFEAIYEYDPDADFFRCELFESESTDLQIYKNGSVKACWTNTPGLNPELEPFNIYVYNEETDKYNYSGYVDSWDVTFSETDNEGNAFPVKHDLDEDGIVFAIQYNDEYAYSFVHDNSDYKELSDRLYSSTTHKINWINL